jgi:hypothetical protein
VNVEYSILQLSLVIRVRVHLEVKDCRSHFGRKGP